MLLYFLCCIAVSFEMFSSYFYFHTGLTEYGKETIYSVYILVSLFCLIEMREMNLERESAVPERSRNTLMSVVNAVSWCIWVEVTENRV